MTFDEQFATEIQSLKYLRGAERIRVLQTLARHAENEPLEIFIDWNAAYMDEASAQDRLDIKIAQLHRIRELYASGPQFDPLREKVLWYYKWIAGDAIGYLEVSRENVELILSQMTDFYDSQHESLRPVYKLRCEFHAFMHEEEQATRFFDLWQSTPAAKSDDCDACLAGSVVEYHLFKRDFDAAFKAAESLLDAKLTCREQPERVISRMLIPLLQNGQGEFADALQRRWFRYVRGTPSMTEALSHNVVFLALTGRSMAARRPALLMLGRGTTTASAHLRYRAWRGGLVWSTMLVIAGVVRVRLSRPFANTMAESSDGLVDSQMLRAHCLDHALRLADAFDTRHGNGKFRESTEGLNDWLRRMMSATESPRTE